MRGGRCVGGRFDVGAEIGNVTPSPALPHRGRGLNRGRSGGGGCVGFAVLRKTCRFARGGAGFCGFDGGGFGVVGRELMRGGLFVFVLFALTPTPLPRGEGLFRRGSGSGWRFGFAILRKTRGFTCCRTGFCCFDGGGFGVVGRGGRCVSVRSRAALFAAPTPTLPHGGRGLFGRRSGGGGYFGFGVLGESFGATGSGAGFCRFDGGCFGVVGRELVRGGLFVFVLFALTPTPLPRGEGRFSWGSGSGWCFGFAILRKTRGFACGSARFRGFDSSCFGVVGREFVRGRRCVGGCFDVGAGIGNVTPSPTLPRCGR